MHKQLREHHMSAGHSLPVVTRFFWPPEMPLIISEPTGMSEQTCTTGLLLKGAILEELQWLADSQTADCRLGLAGWLCTPLPALTTQRDSWHAQSYAGAEQELGLTSRPRMRMM